MPPPQPARPTAELLLENDFVRRLVCAAGDADADDAVQEAWLRARGHVPRDPGRVRAWLRSIAVRALRNAARSERRRAARERAAARPERLPSASEVLQREADRRRVVDAVLLLGEPLRTVVLLRYFDGLTPAAIAARLGLPAPTVRSQLARALAELRRRLDSDFGGRRAWTAFGLPLSAAGVSLAAPIGAAMISKTKLVAAAGVAVVLGYLVWPAGSPAPAAPPAERVANAAAAASAGIPRDEPATAAPDNAPEPAVPGRSPLAEPFRVTCTATEHDQPIAGVPLRLEWYAGYATEGDVLASHDGTTGADGAVVWSCAHPSGPAVLRVSGTGARHRVFSAPQRVQADDRTAELAVRVWSLTCTVRGRVEDEAGQPIAGATVTSNGSWTPTAADRDGRFEMRVGTGDASRPLVAWADGFAMAVLQLEIDEGATERTVTITLHAGNTLRGRVVGEDGAPLADVAVRSAGTAHRPKTDAEGRFALIGLRLDGETATYVSADRPDYGFAYVSVEDSDRPLEIVVPRGRSIAGTVRTAGGRPIAGASLVLELHPFLRVSRRTHSALDGGFDLHGVSTGAHPLVASHPDFAPARLVVDDGAATPLAVVLAPARSIAGRVVDDAGNPIQGAGIEVMTAPRDRMSAFGPLVGDRPLTDADGRFVVSGLPDEPLTVRSFCRGYRAGEIKDVLPGAGEVILTLERAAVVAGRVVDDATGEPITDFTVIAGERRDILPVLRRNAELRHDNEGRWRWDSGSRPFAANQAVVVEIAAEGYAPAVLDCRAVLEPDHDANVARLRPGVMVRGVVVDPQGRPLAGADVFVLENGADEGEIGFRPATTSTATDGTFSLGPLAPGRIRVAARHGNYPHRVSDPIDIGAGPGSLELTIRVGAGLTVRGRVEGHSGPAQVVASTMTHPIRHVTGELAADGTFELHGVAAGRHLVGLVPPGGHRTRPALGRVVEVGDEDVTGFVLTTREGPRSLRAAVVGAAAGELVLRPLEGAFQPGSPALRCLPFADGRIEIDGLAAVRYRLAVEAGSREQSVDLDLRDADALGVVVTLER